MLNRLTVSALLKTVILVTSFCVVVGFSLNAWDSWGRLQAASRIAVIADASASIFKAMHNLRTDRSTTNRLLNSDAPMDADIEKYLRNIRDTEMPAMGNALGLLGGMEFAQHQTLVPEFDRVFKTMTTLQKEFWEAVAKPKAQRRPELAKEYMDYGERDAGDARQAVRQRLPPPSITRTRTIDQLLAIKQIAWLLRNTAGEASLDRFDRAQHREGLAGGEACLHEIYRRHRRRMERAGADRVGDGSCRRRSRARSPRPRPPISSRHISACATGC